MWAILLLLAVFLYLIIPKKTAEEQRNQDDFIDDMLFFGDARAYFLTSQIGANIDSLNVLIIWVVSLIGMTALGYRYGD